MTAAASGPAHGPRSSGHAERLDSPRHQAAGLGPGERGETRVHLVVPERAVERPRDCACGAPSSESMLGPTTWAVEKRGSSTVNVRASRRDRHGQVVGR